MWNKSEASVVLEGEDEMEKTLEGQMGEPRVKRTEKMGQCEQPALVDGGKWKWATTPNHLVAQ